MLKLIIVLHVILFFVYREGVLSLWAVLPWFAGVCIGKFVDDTIDSFYVFVRKGRNRKGT